MSRFEEMYDAVQHRLLTSTYEVAYAYLREHPDYDGYPGEDVPRLLRCPSRPGPDEPYPGIRDVARTTCDQWVPGAARGRRARRRGARLLPGLRRWSSLTCPARGARTRGTQPRALLVRDAQDSPSATAPAEPGRPCAPAPARAHRTTTSTHHH